MSDSPRSYAAFRYLLLSVQSAGEAASRNDLGGVTSLTARIASSYPPATAESVESAVPMDGSKGELHARAFLHLEPIENESWALPVVTFNHDYNVEPPQLRIRLALFRLDSDGDPEAIGFRFEMPESEGGLHAYCHSQLVQTLDQSASGASLPMKTSWLPTTQPALPLDARTPLALLLCVLVSLYGPRRVRNLFSGGAFNAVKTEIESMMCFQRLAASSSE